MALSKKEYSQVLADCTKVILIHDPNNVKAYYRRGMANFKTGEYVGERREERGERREERGERREERGERREGRGQRVRGERGERGEEKF